MNSTDSLCAQLKAHGRRVTPQRRAIIQVLLDDGAHCTAEYIYTQVRSVMPDLSPATVYNTLRELTDMGMLLELDLGLRERRYDIVTSDHAHLVCLQCGRIEDVHYNSQVLQLPSENIYGFEIVDRLVTLRGYCPTCAASKKERS